MSKGLNKDQLDKLREMLLKERTRIANEIRSIVKDASQNPRESSGDNVAGIHMADMAADAISRELSMNIASSEQETLYAIDDAIKRIDEGDYGVCLECEKPIPLNRLKVVPQTSYCIDCQRELEKKNRAKPGPAV